MSSYNDNDMFLYGASGHGKVVIEIAELLGLNVVAFVDDNESLKQLYHIPVYLEIPDDLRVGVISIGNNYIRKRLACLFMDYSFPTLVHPKATISTRATVAKGTVIMAGVTINTNVQIGAHVIVNTNASIDHDSVLEDFVHVSPNVALSGGVIVGEGTHIGVGACVIPEIRIGKWATIGAGTVVITDVPDYAVVVGNPGKIIKYNNEQK